MPETKAALIAQGGDPDPGCPDEFARLIKDELVRNAKITKSPPHDDRVGLHQQRLLNYDTMQRVIPFIFYSLKRRCLMRHTSALTAFGTLFLATSVCAQLAVPPAPWRGAGPTPCVGSDGGVQQCAPAARTMAIRAGRLFDSKTGRMLSKQVVVIEGERIAGIGPESEMRIPAGAQVIDLSQSTVLPGLIDAHTHMFNNPKPGMSRETSTLIAVHNLQADLRAGFTAARDMSSHGNGYADIDIRNAINEGRLDGPRFQVSGRGIVWGSTPAAAKRKTRSAATSCARSNKRKLRCASTSNGALTGSSSFQQAPTHSAQAANSIYVVTYPMPVLQALIDETHRLGHKTACHVYGGEGQKNAIIAGCDTIEHAFGLNQEQADMMVKKGLYYDPTIVRYTEPYMDDNDSKNTGGKVPHDSDF
jgi:imidazolonepropionase-like amidohydrolase